MLMLLSGNKDNKICGPNHWRFPNEVLPGSSGSSNFQVVFLASYRAKMHELVSRSPDAVPLWLLLLGKLDLT